jgi:thiol-disulfide isomerase/thioredoxin
MGASDPKSAPTLTLVYAEWCPHCVPLSTDLAPVLARGLNASLRLLDIDVPEEERQADALVQRYGDWDPDYLIPQVFLDSGAGRVEHLLTGVRGSLPGTRSRWDQLFARFGVAEPP